MTDFNRTDMHDSMPLSTVKLRKHVAGLRIGKAALPQLHFAASRACWLVREVSHALSSLVGPSIFARKYSGMKHWLHARPRDLSILAALKRLRCSSSTSLVKMFSVRSLRVS